MWTLIVISVLTIDPLKIQSDPLITTETAKDCEYLLDTFARHNLDARFLCVKKPTQGEK